MAYGRLDVFWPDGQFKTFALVENTISVGRSGGNTIALDTTTISRYHFSLRYDGQQVQITDLDSANGTFVDGIRLTGNEPRPLYGGEEIQVGHLRIIYHQMDEMPTQPVAVLDETTQRIEVSQPAFRLDVVGPEHPFSPGAHWSAELAITNTGEERRRFLVDAAGMPSDWIRIDRPELEIDPAETAPVLINFRPPRRSDSRPGDYVVTIGVAPSDRVDARLEAKLVIHILPFGGFGVALESPSGDRFRLHLHNQGSAPLSLTVSGHDREHRLRYLVSPSRVTLAPGQRFVLQGEVRPLRPAWVGRPRPVPFDLHVRSLDAAAFLTVVRGQYQEKSVLPSWAPVAAGVSALVVVLVAVALLALLLQPRPEPQILRFEVSTTRVARGEPLALMWQVTAVNEMSVTINGTPVVSRLSPDSTGVDLDTADLSGPITVRLLAAGASHQVEASQSVYVYQPMGDGVFEVIPPQLFRYVVQSVSITWDIPGAVSTRLTGLESFSNMPIQNEYGAQATITGVVGIPSDPLRLILYAHDEAGNSRQHILDVPVINPECVPAGASVTLYAGPDARHQVVGTVPSGAFIVVDAQDSSGRWLRARLAGGIMGWGVRSEFSCPGAFNVADLYKELNVPTVPPPTPTIPPSPTRPPVTLSPGTLAPSRTVSPVPSPQPTAAG